IVHLEPASEWPAVHHDRWYSSWATRSLKRALGAFWPEESPESWDELVAKMNATLHLPGWTNAWTMPIRTRVDMLTTGVRTPVGIKVFGQDLTAIEQAGTELENAVRAVPGTPSVLYERSLRGVHV